MKTVIQIFLLVAILGLGYMLYDSIQQPIRFQHEQRARYNRTIERLKDIRTAQLAYRSVYGTFTGNFDTLIEFVKYDSFRVILSIGDMDDSLAVALGQIVRDTIKVSVRDSLFRRGYPIDSLRYVPYTGGRTQFFLGATKVMTGSGLEVNVFEAHVHNDILLAGLDRQLIINLNDERTRRELFPGLRVGSLTETTNNAGNWE